MVRGIEPQSLYLMIGEASQESPSLPAVKGTEPQSLYLMIGEASQESPSLSAVQHCRLLVVDTVLLPAQLKLKIIEC